VKLFFISILLIISGHLIDSVSVEYYNFGIDIHGKQ